MSRILLLIGGIGIVLSGILAFFSVFTVSETEYALVMQFGEPKRVISDPGLKYKHFWQDVSYYEKRVLNLDPPVESMLLSDSKREREAKEFRAQGEQLAIEIRATADRQVTVIKAEAQREAEILRGAGEGKRTSILNEAFVQDPEFFNFYRSMQAYSAALGEENTYMVLSPDSDFFEFFKQVEPSGQSESVANAPQ